MALQAPKAADLFDGASPVEAAERMEEFQGVLNKALANGSTTPGQAPTDPVAAIEALAINKSLSPEATASLQTALAAQRGAMGDINKEITLTTPLSTSFAAFDLEAPAKLLAQLHSVTESLVRRVLVQATVSREFLATPVLVLAESAIYGRESQNQRQTPSVASLLSAVHRFRMPLMI
jgi:hypothetical protein